MRDFILFTAVALLAAGCGRRNRPDVLSAATMYRLDSIRAAIAVSGADSGRAEDYPVLRDSAGYPGALDRALTRIIYHAPSAWAYLRLAEAKMRQHLYNKPYYFLLEIADSLHYNPRWELDCDWVLCAVTPSLEQPRWEHDSMALVHMRAALSEGCPRPERFLTDTEYAGLRMYPGFKAIYAGAKAIGNDPRSVRWAAFRDGFPEAALPFAIDTAWMLRHDALSEISGYLATFLPSRRKAGWERGMQEGYGYVARVASRPAFVAVVFSDYVYSDMVFTPPARDATDPIVPVLMASTVYYLATYSPAGAPIDHMVVAGHSDITAPLQIFSIDSALAFTVAKQTFRYAPVRGNDVAWRHNPVGAVTGKAARFRIDGEGRFERD